MLWFCRVCVFLSLMSTSMLQSQLDFPFFFLSYNLCLLFCFIFIYKLPLILSRMRYSINNKSSPIIYSSATFFQVMPSIRYFLLPPVLIPFKQIYQSNQPSHLCLCLLKDRGLCLQYNSLDHQPFSSIPPHISLPLQPP